PRAISSVYSLSPCTARRPCGLHSFPTRRSSDLPLCRQNHATTCSGRCPCRTINQLSPRNPRCAAWQYSGSRSAYPSAQPAPDQRSEEHTSELQSRENLVCRLLLEKYNDAKSSAS